MPLQSRLEFYIPIPNGASKHKDIEEWIQMIIEKFGNWFQRTTVRQEVMYAGCIIGNLYYVVCAFCTTKQLQQHFLLVEALVRDTAEHVGCDDVFVAVNGSMYLIFVRL